MTEGSRLMALLADAPSLEVSMPVTATPAVLWELVSDPTLPARFSKELQEAGWDPDGPPPGLGARILGRNAIGAVGEWTTTSYVTAWEPERLLTWAVGNLEEPAAVWSFVITPADAESTTLTQRVQFGPGRSNIRKMIEDRPEDEEGIIEYRLAMFRENIEANLAAYRDLAEGTVTLDQLDS
ncbi:MAG: SRPBCC family protein [Actinomycetota bacterium]